MLCTSGLAARLWWLVYGAGFDAFERCWLVSGMVFAGAFRGCLILMFWFFGGGLVLLIWFLVVGLPFCGLDFLMFGLRSLA